MVQYLIQRQLQYHQIEEIRNYVNHQDVVSLLLQMHSNDSDRDKFY
jgi:hypothetical protein